MYSHSYKRYVTALLLVVYIFNMIDRGVFGFLIEPIKREFGLSDTQLGFLAGPAMVLFYAALGIPVARWADRSHRVNIMSVAVALWSIITAASAAVTNFWQFALVRVGVGVGEAGFSAVAQSVISDYHSATERTRAISIFMLGIPLGGAISYLTAGWINEIYGWRAMFLIAGMPGLLLALLMKWTIKEPPRAHPALAASSAAILRLPLRAVWVALWQRRTLRHLAIGQGLLSILVAFVGWFIVFFMRNHSIDSGELGTWFALIVAIGGGGGVWLGGFLTGRYGSKDERVKLWIMASATALVAPAALIVLWCPSAYLALALLLPVKVLVYFCYGPTFSLVQTLSPASTRATMASTFILIQVMAGGVFGQQMLGILSDALTRMLGDSGSALRWSMTLATPLALWAAMHFWLAGRSIREDSMAAALHDGK